MTEKIAIVTGGTGGIGTAICQKLSKSHLVIASYYKEEDHERALQWKLTQKKIGYDCEIIYGDVRKFEDCQTIVNSIQERYGRVDVLVNNAGMTSDSSLVKMTEEQWHAVMDTNLNSVFNMTKSVVSMMIQQTFGRIISIASINGRKGQFGQCNYAASKSALYGFSKSLAQELAKKGITVNTISPGYIQTPMLENMSPIILNQIIENIPVGRLGKPEEIAQAVEFLVNNGFVTGSNIDINGGQYYG